MQRPFEGQVLKVRKWHTNLENTQLVYRIYFTKMNELKLMKATIIIQILYFYLIKRAHWPLGAKRAGAWDL